MGSICIIGSTAFSQSVLSLSDWIENRMIPVRSPLESQQVIPGWRGTFFFPGNDATAKITKPQQTVEPSLDDSVERKIVSADSLDTSEISLLPESQTPIYFPPYPFFSKNQPLSIEQQARLLQFLAQKAIEKEDLVAAAEYFLQQAEIAHPDYPADAEHILSLLESVDNEKAIQSLERKYKHIDFIRDELPYLRLNLLIEEEQYVAALLLIETLTYQLQQRHSPEQLEFLLNLQKRINLTLTAIPQRIGVILPLSSTNPQIAPLTREALEGLRLGLIASSETMQSGQREKDFQEIMDSISFELIFRDSSLNPKTSAAAVRELVEEEHVIAIIGPLIRRTSEAAAQEAQRLQVPLISLSLTTGIPDIGSFVFRNNQSWQQEMKALARFAYDYKNVRRFLILYPKTREGKNKMTFFWEEMERLGGKIQGGEAFDLGQQNFVRHFESFIGLERYMDPQDKAIMEELEEKQQPVHDFDALFVPIGRNHIEDLKVLLPYSAAYKMDDVLFLGDSGWNDYSILSAIKKYVNETVFVDSFFKQNRQSHVTRFIRLHERYFMRHLNYKGPTSYTAYAYDTVNLLQKLLSSRGNRSHRQLQQALLDMEPYPGVTGTFTFLENGEAHREMTLLSVRSGNIVPVN